MIVIILLLKLLALFLALLANNWIPGFKFPATFEGVDTQRRIWAAACTVLWLITILMKLN